MLSSRLALSGYFMFCSGPNLMSSLSQLYWIWSISLLPTFLPTMFYLLLLLLFFIILPFSLKAWWKSLYFSDPDSSCSMCLWPSPVSKPQRLQDTRPHPFLTHSAPVPRGPHLQEVVSTPPRCTAPQAMLPHGHTE